MSDNGLELQPAEFSPQKNHNGYMDAKKNDDNYEIQQDEASQQSARYEDNNNIDLENNNSQLQTKLNNELNSNENPEENGLKNGDKFQEKVGILHDLHNMALLFMLYLYQGLILGYFVTSVTEILMNDGISESDASMLAITTLPFSFKFILAPIQDTYFFKNFGKRKSWIVPGQYLLALVFFVLSFFFEKVIEEKHICVILATGIFAITVLSIQDIGVDGWSVKILHQDNISYASVMQSMGQFVGGILSGSVFILFNSEKWCQEKLGLDEKLISSSAFLQFLAFSILIGNIYVHFFKQESLDDIDSSEVVGLKDTLIKIKYFYKNKNLFHACLFLFTKYIAFDAIDGIGGLILLGKDHLAYPREEFSVILLWLKPWGLISTVIAARLGAKKIEFTSYLRLYGLKMIAVSFNYFLFKNYEDMDKDLFFWLLGLSCVLDIFLSTVFFIVFSCFFLRQCDIKNAGVFMTFVNSFSNFGSLWTSPLYLALLPIITLDGLYIYAMIVAVIYYFIWRKKLLVLEKSEKKEWQLTEESAQLVQEKYYKN